jgi:hypothetical protein
MSKVFTPNVDPDAAYGEGDWRPLLGELPRERDFKLYMIGKTSIEHKLRGIILPSYDWTLSIADKAFPQSLGACWSDTADKKLPRHFTPNAFALPLLCYPFLGEKKEHWFSPSNLSNMIGAEDLDREAAADAFDDLNRWIRRNKAFDDSKKDFFLKAPSLKEDALVPGRVLRFFALAKCIDKETSWHRAVVGITASSYSYILEQLRWAHRSEDGPARDPNWPHYMLGDPTDPKGAIEWHADKVQLDAKDTYDTNVLCFTERAEFLDDKQKAHTISDDDLASRFMLPDPANWNIPTYEEQVDHMMNTFDVAVSADMIRMACATRYRGEIPSDRPEHIKLTSKPDKRSADDGAGAQSRRGSGRTARETPSPDDGDPTEAVTRSRVAPTNTRPPIPETRGRTAASAAPTKSAVKDDGTTYWAGAAGAKPAKMTVTDLQALADSGKLEGVKVMTAPNKWVPLASSGLVTIPTADEAPPEVPEDEAPPSVPSDEAPTGKVEWGNDKTEDGGITRDAMKARLFPDNESFNRLDKAKQEEAEDLVDRAWKVTNHGRSEELPDEIVNGLMALVF